MEQVNFGNGAPNKDVYVKSFGQMADGSVYHDPFHTTHGQVESSAELKSKFDDIRKGMANQRGVNYDLIVIAKLLKNERYILRYQRGINLKLA